MIAALYTRKTSIYKSLPGVDAWDIDRDARNYPGPGQVICHPPCRGWGQLKHFAKLRPDELDLGRHAVACVRMYGGVLEHPARSGLWTDQDLPEPGSGPDRWGGWTFSAPQFWWGHLANKATWLYIVGCGPKDIPEVPFVLGEPTHTVGSNSSQRRRQRARAAAGGKEAPKIGLGTTPPGGKLQMSAQGRERTPEAFAKWLVELAGKCKAPPVPG